VAWDEFSPQPIVVSTLYKESCNANDIKGAYFRKSRLLLYGAKGGKTKREYRY